MNLATLISELEKRNPDARVKHGFGSGHCDRGYYADAAFEPVDETTFGEMLRHAKELLGSTQYGYKGGMYVMDEYVTVRIGHYGECGEQIGRHHFLYWDESVDSLDDDNA